MRTRRRTTLGFQPPAVGEEEIAAVAETLRSGWLTTGPRTALLEERLAAYLEVEHVLAVSSGTAAMHLALLALGVGPGDEVITSPITWPATANVIEHCGATPVFCDVREDDLNLDPALLPAAVTERTKAILPVHLAGQPCDLDPIRALGLPVVEDAAHALEARYRGRKLGGLSEATCFSLYATKNLAAGEGGLVATNRDDVAEAIRRMRLTRRGDGSRYDQVTWGFKANLSDVLASIALVQLDKLERHAELRARQVALYDDGPRGARGRHTARARPARHARAPPLRRAHRSRRRRRDARRVPACAREGADRDEHPLPPGASPHVVPRALPGAALASRGRARRRRGALAPTLAGPRRGGHPGRGRRDQACPRPLRGMRRPLRIVLTVALTGLALGYLVWKVDLGDVVDTLLDANPWWFALSVGIMIGTALPMALRWQWLMRAQGMDDTFAWLTRAYFVSYTASQVLPTSIGGDAMRVYETARRHPGRTGDVTAIILLERGLGGAGTVLLGAIGFLLALGTYDVGAYLWLEGAFVLGTLVLIFLFFARSARPLLNRTRPLLRRLRVERPLRALYDGVHHFRGHAGLLLGVFLFTTAIQAVRVLSIWAAAKAVGIDLGPRIYYVMGPLFFLVLLVPFTLNGIAVREAFFVSFLGSVGVAADAAFAAGFLFFLVTTALALPGAAILLWEGMRGGSRPRLEHG